MSHVDFQACAPPPEWGVTVDTMAVAALADKWAHDPFPLPKFDYPGTPSIRTEQWWFDYVTLSVSVLACLWPPAGEKVWQTEFEGRWLDDAPGIFAVFTRRLGPDGVNLGEFAQLTNDEGERFFRGRGSLQMIPERVQMLRDVAHTILDRWQGSALNLVNEAGRDGVEIGALLTETIPGYLDRPMSSEGELRFDKLSHLAASIMAAGVGWADAGFTGFDDFPVYPDYMLPRILRHSGVLRYSDNLAALIGGRHLIERDSNAEHAIRWATVHSGHALRSALHERGNLVSAPALDYRLWSEAVLGPDAANFGEHHRTVTLKY